jgi:hypothetical protein
LLWLFAAILIRIVYHTANKFRLGILVIGCLVLSACETMESFYDEVIFASVNETIDETVDNAELSYCAGCDWIVQEFHGKWETRNSKPYDTQSECRAAKRKQEDRDPDIHFRCIHESELH